MKKYHVIADFIDKDTDELVKAGDTFAADDERVEELKDKQLIGKEEAKQSSKPKGNSAPKPDEQVSSPSGEEQKPTGEE